MTDSSLTIRQLTAAVAAGDSDAITHFYYRYFDLMFAEARHASHRDEQFCLDIVQDSMLKVIRSIKPLDTESQLARWTQRLVRSVAFDLLRAEIRRKRREANFARLTEERDDEAEELEGQITRLAADLREIDASDSRLLDVRYKLGWTLERIGRELGISSSAVDGRLRRLVARIRRKRREVDNSD